MLRHIVIFTIREKKDHDTVYEGLSILKGIPDCLHLEIGKNIRHDPVSQASPEFIVYGEFESEEQLALFKGHELYEKSISIVRPLRDMRVAADYDASS